jgi:hypothetical protein
MSLLVDVLKFGPRVFDFAVGFLPASFQGTVRNARHAIVVAAGITVTVLGYADYLPLPAGVAAAVSAVSALASVIVTYWATKATP